MKVVEQLSIYLYCSTSFRNLLTAMGYVTTLNYLSGNLYEGTTGVQQTAA